MIEMVAMYLMSGENPNHVLQISVTEGRSALSVAAAGSVHRLTASACAGCFASSHASVLSNHALYSSLIASAFDRYATVEVSPAKAAWSLACGRCDVMRSLAGIATGVVSVQYGLSAVMLDSNFTAAKQ